MGRGGSLEWKQDECMQVIASLCFSLSCRGLLNVSITFSFDAANKWKTSMVIRAYERVEMPELWRKNCSFGHNSNFYYIILNPFIPNNTCISQEAVFKISFINLHMSYKLFWDFLFLISSVFIHFTVIINVFLFHKICVTPVMLRVLHN